MALVLWETEPQLPGMPGLSRVLVCRGCGAILQRRINGGPAVAVADHLPDCPGARAVPGQAGLFT